MDGLACDSGPYAVILPKHYPSLHGIGRHKVTDLEVRRLGSATVTHRRIEYAGLRLEVRRSPSQPDAYQLLALEATSRRWNIGPLSVGRNPWRGLREPALDGVSLNGTLELAGKSDRVLLNLNDGRVESVEYKCSRH